MAEERTILVIDDDPDVREMLVLALESFGYHCEPKENGQAALERLRRPPRPALVLLDLRMPGVSGEDVLRVIRGVPQLRDLPVVVLSGDRRPKVELEALRVSGVLLKPVDLDDLLEAVGRVFPGPSPGVRA